jgi:hypothetical protein
VVSSDHPVKDCVPADVYLQLLKASPDLPKLKATFQDFLNTVRAAIGLELPGDDSRSGLLAGRLVA